MSFIKLWIFVCWLGAVTAFLPTFPFYDEKCPKLDNITCYWCSFGSSLVDNCPTCDCNNTVEHDEIQIGEIVLTKNQVKRFMDRDYMGGDTQPRAGSSEAVLKWDNLREDDGMWRVPYYFENDPPMSERNEEVIHRAISALFAQTCIRFEPAEVGDKSIIRFRNSSDCSYFIGRKEGIRTIRGCTLTIGEMLKALMHALGFWPEPLRPDRDDYIILFPEHMSVNKYRLTMKLRPDQWNNFSMSYDFSSITGWGPYQYSAFGGITVMNKITGKPVTVNRWAYSTGDLRQIRLMYNCSGVRGVAKTTQCYNLKDYGLGYRGNMNTTNTGITCQSWSSQSPQTHKIEPTLLTASKLELNYCRNPDMRSKPWCYTTNSSIRWDYCNVSVCNESQELLALPTPLESKRGFWGPWSEFGSCTTTCGFGYKYSKRFCVGAKPDSEACPGKYWRYLTCNTSACPLSDKWHVWEPWSECDTDCGNGTRTRVRFCVGTVGEGGCVTNAVENQTCVTGRSCPLYNGGECFNTSDPFGYRGTVNIDFEGYTCLYWNDTALNMSLYPDADLNNNFCRNPDGRRRVPYCFRVRNRRKPCNITECNLIASWGKWGEWSACSSSCSEGVKTRTRRCKNGHYGEGSCEGEVFMTDICNMTCTNGSSFVVDILRKPKTKAPMTTTTPSLVECLNYSDPRSYRGTRRWSKSGKTCQYWDAAYPWKHNYTKPKLIAQAGLLENFCRTPDPNDEVPWCFLEEFYPMKEECDVPYCPYDTDMFSYFKKLFYSFIEYFGLNPNFRFW